METFKNDMDYSFVGDECSLQDLFLETEQINESKLEKKCLKQRFKYSRKTENDIGIIRSLIAELGDDEELLLFSRAFDSPNIINALCDEIQELIIGTWAITPAGINAVKQVSSTDHCRRCVILLDNTHSYKWIFKSGAYHILKDTVRFKFTQNHSKFVAIRLVGGGVLNFVGSMNCSNNPRWENIRINRSPEEFDFIVNFVDGVNGTTV